MPATSDKQVIMAREYASSETQTLWDRTVDRLSNNPTTVFALGLATIAVIAYIDRLTGTELSMTTLYLIPVAVAAWYIGRTSGRIMAIVAGCAQVAADFMGSQGAAGLPTVFWNAAMIIVLSVVVGEVLTRLHTALDSEHELARTDALTGLPNTRSFSELASIELERSRRYSRIFTIAVLDLDNFKSVNDTLGHGAGDRLIRDVGRALRANLRRVDTVARLGGDEFTMVLPETDGEQAAIAMSHVRVALRELTAAYGPVVQASIGAVTFSTPPKTVAEMLRLADTAMYRAKATGRDRVVSITLPGDATNLEEFELSAMSEHPTGPGIAEAAQELPA
jgi:diguanylate cyclase (GGDEF)-like protein